MFRAVPYDQKDMKLVVLLTTAVVALDFGELIYIHTSRSCVGSSDLVYLRIYVVSMLI